jgi:energy-coupling factor transporter ATP-binding protein EcfA2
VEYGDEWLDDLEQMVLDCSDYNNQLFFAGHRGCGKSTLLAEFAQRLDDRYFTVFFSIADLIEIVVIIDDLDKLELEDVQKIFKQNLNILLQPNFIVIYTIPIATIRDGVLKNHIEDAISNLIFVMPVVKIYAKGDSHLPNPQMVPAAMDKLCEILRKRIDSDLLPADIALQVGAFSGGVMRELIRIAQECCRLMLVQLRQRQRRQESITSGRLRQRQSPHRCGNSESSSRYLAK